MHNRHLYVYNWAYLRLEFITMYMQKSLAAKIQAKKKKDKQTFYLLKSLLLNAHLHLTHLPIKKREIATPL